MQWASCISRNILVERAKEELEILEFHHPNKYESMKLELKAFISELESQDLVSNTTSMTPCPSAATQESSSIKKRKRRCPPVEEVEASNVKDGSCVKRRCRTDAVLERAQLCLHKIQHLKTTFF